MDNPTLESRLALLRNMSAERLPHLMALNKRFFDELITTIPERARAVGDPVPDIDLTVAQTGRPTRVSWMLEGGAAVIVFYRGHWDPYSNVQAQTLAEMEGAIRSFGAQILMIGPETQANAAKMAAKWNLDFPVICDTDGAAMDAFGLAYEIPSYMREDYAHIGFPDLNPGTGWRLPVCATYIADRLNVIRLRHLDVDYTRRMEPADVITALRKLKRSLAA
jgi:peroxiredoxin